MTGVPASVLETVGKPQTCCKERGRRNLYGCGGLGAGPGRGQAYFMTIQPETWASVLCANRTPAKPSSEVSLPSPMSDAFG